MEVTAVQKVAMETAVQVVVMTVGETMAGGTMVEAMTAAARTRIDKAPNLISVV
jgi:hypothetical protein